MKSLNQVFLLGNLTADPELRTTSTGKSVCTFSIATNYEWKDEDGEKQTGVDYHNVVAWNGLAEVIHQFMRKGSQVHIQGSLKTRSWEDSGVKHYKTEVIADELIMLGRKEEADGVKVAADELPV